MQDIGSELLKRYGGGTTTAEPPTDAPGPIYTNTAPQPTITKPLGMQTEPAPEDIGQALYAKYHVPTAGEWVSTLTRNLLVNPSIQTGEAAVTANAVASHAIAAVIRGTGVEHPSKMDWKGLWSDFTDSVKDSGYAPTGALLKFVGKQEEKGSRSLPPISEGVGMQGVKDTKEFYNREVPEDAAAQQTTVGKLSQQAGGIVGMGEQAAILGATGLGAPAAWGIAMADTGAAAQFADAKAHGATDEQASVKWAEALGVNAAMAPALGAWFAAAEKIGGPPIAKLIAGGLSGSGGMVAMNAATNALAQSYDPKRGILEGSVDAAKFGGLFGLVASAVHMHGEMQAAGEQNLSQPELGNKPASEAKVSEGIAPPEAAKADALAGGEEPSKITGPAQPSRTDELRASIERTGDKLAEEAKASITDEDRAQFDADAQAKYPGLPLHEAVSKLALDESAEATQKIDTAQAAQDESLRVARSGERRTENVPVAEEQRSGEERRAPEEPPKLTSTKNAVTEAERAERGAPPLEETLKKTWGTSLDTARAAMEKDPSLGERIVKGEATPELSRDEREAALASEKVAAHTEYERVRDAALAEVNNPDAFKALEEQRQKLSDRLLEIDKATKAEGTESGRALAIRRMMLARDYSIAAIETEFRIAKGGAQLTPEEHAKVGDLSRRLIAAEKQVEEIEGRLTVQREAKASVDRKAKVLSFLDAQAEQARARLKAKRGRAGGGLPFDPQDIADVARIAASHIAHGIDAAAQLVKDFGEAIKPHLEEILAQARKIHEAAPKQSGSERAAITRATKTAAKLRSKTAAQDFEPEQKPAPLPMTLERLRAKTDLEEARKEYESAKAQFRFQNRTTFEKARDVGREAVNLPKQLLTGFDLSATLFQGGALASSHPIISAKAFKESLRALSSERRSLEIDTALRNREHAAEGEKAGLELTKLDGPVSAHEEHIRSNWAGKIPLGIGKGIEASNRAFTTFLNVQRALTFDKMTEALPDKSPEAQNAVANFVNVATGRGYTPAKFKGAISAAANVLWSPRLLISRFQLLAGQPLYRGTAASRRAIAVEYAKSLAALGAVYTVAGLAGADVEKDPRSSAFGKIKVGNVYVDPMLGLSQVTHIISEVGSGEKKNAKGELVPLREPITEDGKGPRYGQSNTADELFSFLRKKFSPTIGIPLDLLAGKNVVGQPVKPSDIPQQMFVPLAFQDVYKAMKDGGMPEAAALGLLSVLGAHVEVHDQGPPKEHAALPKRFGPRLPSLR